MNKVFGAFITCSEFPKHRKIAVRFYSKAVEKYMLQFLEQQ